jgi:hypothetical protein
MEPGVSRPVQKKSPGAAGAFFLSYEAVSIPAVAAATISAPLAAASTAEAAAGAARGAGEFLAGTRFVDGQIATLEILAMKLIHGALRLFIRGHGHEAEAARFAGHFILNEDGLADRSGGGEEIQKIVFGGVEGKIPDVKFVTHITSFCLF